jgi:hypothetical protein
MRDEPVVRAVDSVSEAAPDAVEQFWPYSDLIVPFGRMVVTAAF